MIGGSGGGGGGPNSLQALAGAEETKAFDPHVARRLLGFLAPFRLRMSLAVIFMTLSTAFTLLAPYLMKVAIDRDIAGRDLRGLAVTVGWIALTFAAIFLTDMGQRYQLSWVGQRVLSALRERMFSHLQALHLGYHDRHIVGVTVSRVINDVAVINDLLSQGLVSLIGDTLLLGGTIVIMLSMDYRLALLCFSVLPLMLIATRLFARRAKSAFRETRRSVASVVGDLAEDISGMRAIQAFAQERRSQARFARVNGDNRNANIRATSLSYVFLPSVDFLGMLATAIVIWFGGIAVEGHVITLGVIVAFLSYVTRFFQPIREISQLFTTAQSAMAGGEQIFRLLDTEPLVTDPPGGAVMPPISGRVAFEDVCFSYTSGVEVLKHVSFEVTPGRMIALVGPTGAGKTTIAGLVSRFYDPGSGAVLVDGVDIRTVTQQSYRRQLAVVPQDPFLFAGTILDNIRFGRPQADREEVEQAGGRANADRFIRALQDGYETVVQEGAANLSVGQRQLICIARAVLVDPRILILDEATANIDSVTEILIQQAMERLFEGRTSFVVAHRLSTIRKADTILVVKDGRIAESGSHEQLLTGGTIYRELYERQYLTPGESRS